MSQWDLLLISQMSSIVARSWKSSSNCKDGDRSATGTSGCVYVRRFVQNYYSSCMVAQLRSDPSESVVAFPFALWQNAVPTRTVPLRPKLAATTSRIPSTTWSRRPRWPRLRRLRPSPRRRLQPSRPRGPSASCRSRARRRTRRRARGLGGLRLRLWADLAATEEHHHAELVPEILRPPRRRAAALMLSGCTSSSWSRGSSRR